jgi:hypothetical protein
MLHGSRKPLTMWFRAIFEFVSRKYGSNAIGPAAVVRAQFVDQHGRYAEAGSVGGARWRQSRRAGAPTPLGGGQRATAASRERLERAGFGSVETFGTDADRTSFVRSGQRRVQEARPTPSRAAAVSG